MVTVFNRRDLIETFDIKRFNEVREQLEKYKIAYTYRTASLSAGMGAAFSSRSRYGSAGINSDKDLEYTIFVKKTDYDRAAALLHGEHLL